MKLVLKCSVAALMCIIFSHNSVRAENEGKWAVGVRGGLYKLVLTDHSDAWTPGWLVNADLKYGLTNKWSIGAEGSWMKTYLADLSGKGTDGAGASFDKIPDGPQQRAYVAGLLAQYNFTEDSKLTPYLTLGTGMYIWKWTDKDGNTLMSDDPALDEPSPGAGDVPDVDKAGNPYELKDKELYVMGGLGLEYKASDLISIGLGARFRYLTHVLTDFTDDKDIVGPDPGELDLPRGIVEGLLGLTFHFGGGCTPVNATSSADPASGSVPLDVQFTSSVTGGCPDYSYLWDFGDSTTSTDANPKHTYAKDGAYTASLTVKDSKQHPALSSVTVTASCPPLAVTASANPPSGDTPLTVQFQAQPTGGCPPFTYAWDFGDGTKSAEQNPSHTYTTAGHVAPSLTVTDGKGVTAKQATAPVVATSAFVPTAEKPIILEGVHFQSGKAVLAGESSEILDRVAESLIAHPDVKVEIGGHTDSDGSAASNQKLSEKRANTVRDYLVKKGVPASQMTAKGYGEATPISDNKTPEGKAMNRRVELKRI
jgi:outer membrane protein OmpA-like peptidoglycan-associated protein/opacity protein-like surface antigen